MAEFDEFVVDLNADCVCGCMDAGRFHKIYHFPNDYGASVVNNPKKAGFSGEGYRALVLKFSSYSDFMIIAPPQLGVSVIECNDWSETAVALKRIKDL
jgi:hypothetical protein